MFEYKARYEEAVEFYQKRIEELKKDRETYLTLYCESDRGKTKLESKVAVYESILRKQGILGDGSVYSDGTFIYKGEVYRPVAYHLDTEPGKPSEMTVDFVRVAEV